jgi:hypothetical protein
MKISLTINDCTHTESEHEHPNIQSITANFTLPEAAHPLERYKPSPIGTIDAYTFNTASMCSISTAQFWLECQQYDNAHGTKLDKIENFLGNDSFKPAYESKVATAETIVFIDKVWLTAAYRGQRRGHAMVRSLLEALDLPGHTVTMLQAGGLSLAAQPVDEMDGDATEKLTRYWKAMGFSDGATVTRLGC